jgi:hypothetical protein
MALDTAVSAAPKMQDSVSKFLGLTAEGWTAFGTMGLAVFTAVLVATAIYQILAIRAENKKSQTLAACVSYESNPNLFQCMTVLWAARENGDIENHTKTYRPQMAILLNYLDGIAIGIDQGLYIEDLAWDHMEAIVAAHVKYYIDSRLIQKAGLEPENFRRLVALRDRWAEARPRFRDGNKFFRRSER